MMATRIFYAAAVAAGTVAVIALAALGVITVIDVGGRYLFNKPLLGAIEMSEFPIGKLFLAGILLTLMFILTIAIVTWRDPKLAPQTQPRATLAERLIALREVWAVAALFALVIGGMYGGAFTAPEAAVNRRQVGSLTKGAVVWIA
jgi:hypothetical protein